MQIVLKTDFNLSSFKKSKAQVTNCNGKKIELSKASFCKARGWQAASSAADRQKSFTVQVIHNHQNDHIYAVNKEYILLNERIAYKRL